MLFAEKELIWRLYILAKALPIIKWIQIIGHKEFAAIALDLGKEAFVIYMAFLGLSPKMSMHPAWKTQRALLVTEEVTILARYSNFANVFIKKLAAKLLKHFDINKYSINLESDKYPPYRSIYSLGPVELKTFKTYIETNLANGFIRLSKSPVGTLILFV